MYELLHAGFDTLDVAFKGGLLVETIEYLKPKRDEAQQRQEPILIEIGSGKIKAHLMGHGLSGGYAFILDTGPTGGQFRFKANSDPNQWNVFVKLYAETLASHSYPEIRDSLFATLDAMGCRYTEHAVNRVDFAMDFRADGLKLEVNSFVAHSRVKVKSHWSAEQNTTDNQPTTVTNGRALESVTIGKMPGRQIIVYDKRKDAIAKRKHFWFKIWDIDRQNPNSEIWRVELRAGKKELKDRWNIRTFQDFENSIGDVFNSAIENVRYLDKGQSDQNVTRQRVHPLWLAVGEGLARKLTDCRSGLTPGQVKEIARETTLENYRQNIAGNAAGLAVALGLSNEEIEERLPSILTDLGEDAVRDPKGRILKSIQRARERLYFIDSNS